MKALLITGANRGIGLEFVRQLSRRNPAPEYVFASCRNPEKAKELQALAADHKNIKILEIDVQNEATYGSAVEKVTSLVGKNGLNLLINNAGIFSDHSYETVSREFMTNIMDANFISPMRLTQAFLPLLRKAAQNSPVQEYSIERAAVISISTGYSSISGNTSGGHAGYRESKLGLNMFTKSLSIALQADRILVLAQCPGWVQTDMGGPDAAMTTASSVSGMLKIFSMASTEQNGLAFSNSLPLSEL